MKIRKSVFETNSSSSHSVVIDRNATDFEPVWTGGDEYVTIIPGEFGWCVEVLRSWDERASYAYTHAINYGTACQLELLRKVIEDFTGKPVRFSSDSSYWENGYIDHQSVGLANEAFESETVLKQFIFGDRSLVVIDNDNH